MRHFLQRHGVTAVLAEFGPNGALLRRAVICAGIPLYVHAAASTQRSRRVSVISRRHYRRLFRDATGDIAPSGPLAGRLAEIGCDSAKVLASPCGIDLPERGKRRGRPEVFLAVGRLVEKKSPLSTLHALAKMVG